MFLVLLHPIIHVFFDEFLLQLSVSGHYIRQSLIILPHFIKNYYNCCTQNTAVL